MIRDYGSQIVCGDMVDYNNMIRAYALNGGISKSANNQVKTDLKRNYWIMKFLKKVFVIGVIILIGMSPVSAAEPMGIAVNADFDSNQIEKEPTTGAPISGKVCATPIKLETYPDAKITVKKVDKFTGNALVIEDNSPSKPALAYFGIANEVENNVNISFKFMFLSKPNYCHFYLKGISDEKLLVVMIGPNGYAGVVDSASKIFYNPAKLSDTGLNDIKIDVDLKSRKWTLTVNKEKVDGLLESSDSATFKQFFIYSPESIVCKFAVDDLKIEITAESFFKELQPNVNATLDKIK